MLQKIGVYGIIAGVIVGVPMFAMVALMKGPPPAPWGHVIGYLTMLIALSAVFVAIKRHRDLALGGVIRFLPAFGLGLGISLVASLIYVVAWEATLYFTKLDFATEYTKMVLDEQKAAGASPEVLKAKAAELEGLMAQYANPLFRLPMTFVEIFPVGLLVSLVSAGLLRNPRFLPRRG
jgi:Protein of unknown function (DUF4199)